MANEEGISSWPDFILGAEGAVTFSIPRLTGAAGIGLNTGIEFVFSLARKWSAAYSFAGPILALNPKRMNLSGAVKLGMVFNLNGPTDYTKWYISSTMGFLGLGAAAMLLAYMLWPKTAPLLTNPNLAFQVIKMWMKLRDVMQMWSNLTQKLLSFTQHITVTLFHSPPTPGSATTFGFTVNLTSDAIYEYNTSKTYYVMVAAIGSGAGSAQGLASLDELAGQLYTSKEGGDLGDKFIEFGRVMLNELGKWVFYGE